MCKLLFRRNKLVLLCALALRMAAQSTTGSIVGVVSDPSGAVVPNAAVVVTDDYPAFIIPGQTAALASLRLSLLEKLAVSMPAH